MQEVITGDCLEVLPNITDIDVVVCSPPYNLNQPYKTYKDKLPREQYLIWLKDFFQIVKNSLKDNGSFFLNIGSSSTDPWLPIDVANQFRDLFVLQNHFAWIKSITVKDESYGHFTPVNSPRFVNNTYEHIFHLTKKGDVPLDRISIGVPYADKMNETRWNSEKDVRCRGNSWFIPYETVTRIPQTGIEQFLINEEVEWITVTEAAELAKTTKGAISKAVNDGELRGNGETWKHRRVDANDLHRWINVRANPIKKEHPAIFPVELARNCIQLHGIKTDMLVVDPFLGWGSTLIACKELGVNGIGIEIDAEYVETAKARINSSGSA